MYPVLLCAQSPKYLTFLHNSCNITNATVSGIGRPPKGSILGFEGMGAVLDTALAGSSPAGRKILDK